MHRLFIVFLSLLFIFSYNHHLVVRKTNEKIIPASPSEAPVKRVTVLMVNPYCGNLVKNMITDVAVIEFESGFRGKGKSFNAEVNNL